MASRTLLIVESPGVDSGRYRALAQSAGFKVLTANGGAMTTSLVRRAQPALVFVSPHTRSPGPSEIARWIKEDPETTDIPVLILVPNERARKNRLSDGGLCHLRHERRGAFEDDASTRAHPPPGPIPAPANEPVGRKYRR